MTTYNTVILKDYTNAQDERDAASAITPGMLIEFTSADTVQPHSTADGAAAKLFAIEDALQGNGIDDAYAAGDPVRFRQLNTGDEVYTLIADGENIAIGDKLVSNGNGRLKEREGASSGEVPGSIIGTALEALDLRSSSGAESTYRCRVKID